MLSRAFHTRIHASQTRITRPLTCFLTCPLTCFLTCPLPFSPSCAPCPLLSCAPIGVPLSELAKAEEEREAFAAQLQELRTARPPATAVACQTTLSSMQVRCAGVACVRAFYV